MLREWDSLHQTLLASHDVLFPLQGPRFQSRIKRR